MYPEKPGHGSKEIVNDMTDFVGLAAAIGLSLFALFAIQIGIGRVELEPVLVLLPSTPAARQTA